MPSEPQPEVGMTLIMQTQQGNIPVMISEVKEDAVILNLNHPLAGKNVVYEINVIRKIEDLNEKIKAFINFLFRRDLDFSVEKCILIDRFQITICS